MLKNVHLKNLALIKEARIDFSKGLNIMTGETGSGKSVIIGSVNLALGQKANKSIIRTGASSAVSELLFTDCSEEALKILDELKIERSGRNIMLSRKITPDSSVSRINGEAVTLSNLKKISSVLVDVHGQHDNQSLLNPAGHIHILDEFAGENTAKIKQRLGRELALYRSLRSEFKLYGSDEASMKKEMDLLEYEISEIDSSMLKVHEDEALEETYKTLCRLRENRERLCRIKALFCDDKGGLVQESSVALKEIEDAFKSDPSLLSFKNSISDIDSLIKDFSRELNRYLSENGFDEEKFAAVSKRLDEINELKEKYAPTIEGILKYRQKCEERLTALKDAEKNSAGLCRELADSRARVNAIAKELSAQRRKSAAMLEPLACENLRDLNFQDSRFCVSFTAAPKITSEGYDRVQFLISLNPGEPLKPLSETASGGELSRIMLALKSALAEKDHIETLIFDEIDTGISGFTAGRVAQKLKTLSKNHQVICITHLPQIAAKAESHFVIEKEVTDGSTISGIRKLSEEEAVYELARMISSGEITPSALEHAREMKAEGK